MIELEVHDLGEPDVVDSLLDDPATPAHVKRAVRKSLRSNGTADPVAPSLHAAKKPKRTTSVLRRVATGALCVVIVLAGLIFNVALFLLRKITSGQAPVSYDYIYLLPLKTKNGV